MQFQVGSAAPSRAHVTYIFLARRPVCYSLEPPYICVAPRDVNCVGQVQTSPVFCVTYVLHPTALTLSLGRPRCRATLPPAAAALHAGCMAVVSASLLPLFCVDGRALCHLLLIDDTRILLDCGWTDDFSPGIVDALKHVAPHLDAVLISHSDVGHVGALAHLVARLGCKAPLFATPPVHRMGQLTMYDAVLGRIAADPGFSALTVGDVDSAFKLATEAGGAFHTLRCVHRTAGGCTRLQSTNAYADRQQLTEQHAFRCLFLQVL